MSEYQLQHSAYNTDSQIVSTASQANNQFMLLPHRVLSRKQSACPGINIPDRVYSGLSLLLA